MKRISKRISKHWRTGWLKQSAAAACGLALLACGADLEAVPQSQDAMSSASPSTSASAVTLPFPDEYFDMLLAREAAANPDGGEDCAPLLEKYTAAWSDLQNKPQFTQLTDNSAWKKAAELREGYAGSGCFTSGGGSLSKPSETCRPDFGKLVEAWHAVTRLPQFHVLISDAANHDVYATWGSLVTARCVISS